MNSGSKVLLGVLAGAATGAILGVLFAPEKGDETRRRITEGSKDVAGNLKEKFSEFVDSVADKYDTAKESASDLIEKGRAKAGSIASAIKSEANSVAHQAADLVSGAKSGNSSGAGNQS